MKYAIRSTIFICSLLLISTVSATDYPNTTPPAGATPCWSWSCSGWDRYQAPAWSNWSASSSTYNGSDGENILGIDNGSLRSGNVDMSTIPTIIVNVINVLLGIAGTVAIFSLIYHAVQMQINSGITGDSSWVDKAKKGMIGALIGFIIAILAWFLVTRAVELLSGAS